SSLRILIADCTPSAMQAEFGRFGAQTNAELVEAALRLHRPDLHCASVNVADGDALPKGMPIETFDGVILTGSPLPAYDNRPGVGRHELANPIGCSTAGLRVLTPCARIRMRLRRCRRVHPSSPRAASARFRLWRHKRRKAVVSLVPSITPSTSSRRP